MKERTGGRAAAASFPSVSVIIPARDAEKTIGAALDAVLSQEYAGSVEVFVADGSESPATSDMIRRQYPTVRLIPNPDRNIVPGLAACLRVATGSVIARCDAHTFFTPGYLRRAVESLRRTGAANVGGRQRPVGTTFFTRAVAMAMIVGAGSFSTCRAANCAAPASTITEKVSASNTFSPASDATTPNRVENGTSTRMNGAPSRKPRRKTDFVVGLGMGCS